jgi:hypothetical protein
MDARRCGRTRSKRASILALVAGLALVGSCTVESTPSGPTAVPLAVKTLLPASASVPVLSLVDAVRITAMRPDGEIAGQTTAAVQSGQSTLTLELEVELTEPIQTLTLVVELLVGEVVALSGTQTVEVDASQPLTNVTVITLNPVAPALEVTPPLLEYSVITGATPYEFPFRVTNSGGSVLAWAATTDVPGLTIEPPLGDLTQGQSQSVLAVQDPAQLQPGTYGGSITVTAPLALSSPQVIEVAVEVTEPPVIDLSTALLEFVTAELNSPTPQELTLGNVGAGPLSWTASTDATWLAVDPSAGVLGPQETVVLTVTPSTESLALGNHSATITIEDPNASNSPLVVEVQVFVDEGPLIGLSTTSVTFDAWLGENPPSQQVIVTNDGGSTLSWRAFHTSPWLTVGPSSGSLTRGQSSTLTLSASVAGLALGSYSGSVTVQDGNAANSPRAIAVNLTVSERPTIGLSTTSMTFVDPCEGDPAAQPLIISNTGGSPLQWQITDDATWLSASPTSGTLEPGQSQSVSIMAQGGLPYVFPNRTATLSVQDPDASNSPRTVAVELESCGELSPSQ